MATLTNKTIASTYTSLLKLEGDTGSTVDGDNSNAVQVKTGDNDATPLYLNTDRLGIGGQPSLALTVQGASGNIANFTNGTNSLVAYVDNSNVQIANNTDLSGAEKINMSTANEAIEFYQGGSEKMRLNATGLGIGESSPDQLLHLKATSGSQVLLQRTSADTGSVLGAINFGASDGDEYLATIISQHDGQTDSAYLAFQTEATGGSKAERMRITSTGNIAFGGLTPSSYYGDYDNLVLGATSGSTGITVVSGTSNSGTIAFADGTSSNARYRGEVGFNHSNEFLFFNTAGSYRMLIDTSGNVGIGASPQTALSPNLTIEGASPALILRDSNSLANNFYTIYSANGDIEHYFDHEKSVSFATTTDYFGSGESTKLKIDGATGNSDFQGNYIVNEQGRQNHVANTMSSPYYRFDGTDDGIDLPHASLGITGSTPFIPFSIGHPVIFQYSHQLERRRTITWNILLDNLFNSIINC